MFKSALFGLTLYSFIVPVGLSDDTDIQSNTHKEKSKWQELMRTCFSIGNKSALAACSSLLNHYNLRDDQLAAVNGYIGYNHLLEGDYKLAAQFFTVSLEHDPYHKEFLSGRAYSYLKLKQFKRAEKDYTQLLKLDPKHLQSYFNRGDLYRQIGQYKKAIHDFETLTKLIPDGTSQSVTAHAELGYTYHEIKAYSDAITSYSKALEIDKDNSSILAQRGLSYRKNGQTAKAIADYTKALSVSPGDAVVYNNRAWAFMTIGKLKEGLDDVNRALDLETLPDRLASFYDTRGHIFEALGRSEDAITDFQKAFELKPLDRYRMKLRDLGALKD